MIKNNKKKIQSDMKKEAIKRLKLLGLEQSLIDEFKEFDIINKSDYGKCINYIFDDEQKFIKEIEEKENCLIYHIIESQTNKGVISNYLYVSNNKDVWRSIYRLMEGGISPTYANYENTQQTNKETIYFQSLNNKLKRKFA